MSYWWNKLEWTIHMQLQSQIAIAISKMINSCVVVYYFNWCLDVANINEAMTDILAKIMVHELAFLFGPQIKSDKKTVQRVDFLLTIKIYSHVKFTDPSVINNGCRNSFADTVSLWFKAF